MIGLRSNFGPSLVVAAAAFSIAVAAAILVWFRHRDTGRPWLVPVARILTVGAIVVVIFATALPRRLGIEAGGDLVLKLGGAGLAEWRRALSDPGTLPSIQLFANVLLYLPVGFWMVFGWYHRRHMIVPVCLGLSITIETVQYFGLGRVAALDDVVLNGAGAAIGWLGALLLTRSIDDDRMRSLGLR